VLRIVRLGRAYSSSIRRKAALPHANLPGPGEDAGEFVIALSSVDAALALGELHPSCLAYAGVQAQAVSLQNGVLGESYNFRERPLRMARRKPSKS
jgi:hypothetical protein